MAYIGYPSYNNLLNWNKMFEIFISTGHALEICHSCTSIRQTNLSGIYENLWIIRCLHRCDCNSPVMSWSMKCKKENPHESRIYTCSWLAMCFILNITAGTCGANISKARNQASSECSSKFTFQTSFQVSPDFFLVKRTGTSARIVLFLSLRLSRKPRCQ